MHACACARTPACRCAWHVGAAAESALSSVVFAGMLLGVYCLGAVSDAAGRRAGFLLSAVTLGAAGLASAAAPSFAVRPLAAFAGGGLVDRLIAHLQPSHLAGAVRALHRPACRPHG